MRLARMLPANAPAGGAPKLMLRAEAAYRFGGCRCSSGATPPGPYLFVGEVAVNRCAGDAQHLRDVGRRDSLVPQAPRLRGIGLADLAGATAFTPVVSSCGQPGASASTLGEWVFDVPHALPKLLGIAEVSPPSG